MLSPPPGNVVTRGAKRRLRSTPKESSTGRISSMWERVVSNIPIVNRHKLSHNFQKGKVHVSTIHRAHSFQRLLYTWIRIYHTLHMPKIMTPYNDNIVNVKGGGNCGYRVIARHMSMGEKKSHIGS